MAVVKYKPDYFLKDYATIREEMISRLPIISEGKLTDLNESSISVTLVEVFAAIADMLAFYLDSSALEAFLPTVRQPENVHRLAKLIGYRIRGVTSAQGKVQFTLGVAMNDEVFIPKGTRLATITGGGINDKGLFITTENAVIPIGQTESELVTAIQGTPYTETFVGTGASNQSAQLAQQSIDISTLRVTSGNVLWTQVDSFLYSQVEDRHYYVEEDYLGVIRIYFGDGKYGKVPAVGETVSVEYLRSSGADGNVGAGSISLILTTISTLAGAVVNAITVTNPDSTAGGSSKQSLEQVKTNAPGSLSALYRPMTKYDYNALLLRLGGIQHVNVWGEQEENPPSYENMNWANVCLVPVNGGLPSQNLKEIVKEYLLDYQPITVRVRFIDPEYIYVNVSLDVYITPGYSLKDTRIKIADDIKEFFELENVKFGQDIRVSRFYKIAMDYDEVNHVFVDDLVTYDPDADEETTVGQQLVLQKWQIPVLNDLEVTVYEATELPIPDLYPDETLDESTLWDYDG
jgi:hypothetical protein